MTPAQRRSAASKKAARSRKRMAEAKACEADAPTKVTKSDRIIDLLATTDLTREQIAARIGCLPAYVRVVEQRLAAERGNGPQDRWHLRNSDKRREDMRIYMRKRYRTDPEFRDKKLVRSRLYYRKKRAESRA